MSRKPDVLDLAELFGLVKMMAARMERAEANIAAIAKSGGVVLPAEHDAKVFAVMREVQDLQHAADRMRAAHAAGALHTGAPRRQ